MKLPKESTLWKWVIIGFGLIIGVTVIAFMNFLNDLLNSEYGNPVTSFESGSIEASIFIIYLSGKLVSIFTGCFTAGAVIHFLKPAIDFRSLLLSGSIFIILSLFDLLFYSFPLWYKLFSLILPIPSVIFGSKLIRYR